MWAVGSNHENSAVVEALLKAGADVDASSYSGDTDVHRLAEQNGYSEILLKSL